MFNLSMRRAGAGLAAGLLLATAACSSQGGPQSAQGAGETPRLTFAMVTHGAPVLQQHL